MFYYYGRKKRLAGLYPAPAHDLIIEPFAGSAAYSLHEDNWQRDVWINDLDPAIYQLWLYLQQASQFDILALPDELRPGENLDNIKYLSPAERTLISLHVSPGDGVGTRSTVSKFSRWSAGQQYVARSVDKIRHWKITQLEYFEVPNLKATWFIDPPYQRSGKGYKTDTVLFDQLAIWCRARTGQVIVCEQVPANWLPFRQLADIAVAGKNFSYEVVWVRP